MRTILLKIGLNASQIKKTDHCLATSNDPFFMSKCLKWLSRLLRLSFRWNLHRLLFVHIAGEDSSWMTNPCPLTRAIEEADWIVTTFFNTLVFSVFKSSLFSNPQILGFTSDTWPPARQYKPTVPLPVRRPMLGCFGCTF